MWGGGRWGGRGGCRPAHLSAVTQGWSRACWTCVWGKGPSGPGGGGSGCTQDWDVWGQVVYRIGVCGVGTGVGTAGGQEDQDTRGVRMWVCGQDSRGVTASQNHLKDPESPTSPPPTPTFHPSPFNAGHAWAQGADGAGTRVWGREVRGQHAPLAPSSPPLCPHGRCVTSAPQREAQSHHPPPPGVRQARVSPHHPR